MNNTLPPEQYRITLRILLGLIIIGFIAALWFIVKPFVAPLLWAIVLTTTTWPMFRAVRDRLPSPPYLAPLVVTILWGAILLILLIPLPLQLASEAKDFMANVSNIDWQPIKAQLASLPIIGPYLAQAIESVFSGPTPLQSIIGEHQTAIISFATTAARGVLTTILSTIASLVGCYILYRHGERLLAQFRTILVRIGGERVPDLIDTVNLTVRGAAYSVLATAIAQGTLAGIGYFFAGAPTPLLLAAATMVVSILPFGSPMVYVPVSAYLLFFSGLPWYHGVGLAAWGALVVSTIDNFLRPLFISQTTKLSAILVFLGVFGGVASFGLLGAFIGPALIAVARWLWMDFAQPCDARKII